MFQLSSFYCKGTRKGTLRRNPSRNLQVRYLNRGLMGTWRFMGSSKGSFKGPFKGIYRDSIRV